MLLFTYIVVIVLLYSTNNINCQISQSELLANSQNSVSGRFQYICGSDPYRFYSEFPCNMYPICRNGGFKINVGCNFDYQCTPYSQSSVCVDNCCCSVPRIIGPDIITTTRRFFDNSGNFNFNPIFLISYFCCFLVLMF